MRIQSITRLAALGALVAGLACGKNLDTMAKPDQAAVTPDSSAQNPSGYKAGARDTTMTTQVDSAGLSDSASANQTKTGVTDTKTGESVTGDTVTQTRPDEGQPVTAKGDTLNAGVDSTMTPSIDTTMAAPSDSAK